MPRYDYKCEECGQIVEAIHGMNETPDLQCVQCESELSRYYGNQVLQFKPVNFGFNDKAGARVFNSEKEMKEFERSTGSILLSNEEIKQEQAMHKRFKAQEDKAKLNKYMAPHIERIKNMGG